MSSTDFASIIEFLKRVESLKSTTRSAWTAAGTLETTAAHTWRLCLFAMAVADRFPHVDHARLIRMLLVHDLAEAVSGDIPAPAQVGAPPKSTQERADLAALVAPLSDSMQAELLGLWEEYESASSPEARVAKALDKLETILQHVQGENPPGFDYAFNLAYGTKATDAVPELAPLRALLDTATAARARDAAP